MIDDVDVIAAAIALACGGGGMTLSSRLRQGLLRALEGDVEAGRVQEVAAAGQRAGTFQS